MTNDNAPDRTECYANGCTNNATGVYEILYPPSAVVKRRLCDECGDEIEEPPVREL